VSKILHCNPPYKPHVGRVLRLLPDGRLTCRGARYNECRPGDAPALKNSLDLVVGITCACGRVGPERQVKLVPAWPQLPEVVRSAVLAIVPNTIGQ
jgi:hypothetical protein